MSKQNEIKDQMLDEKIAEGHKWVVEYTKAQIDIRDKEIDKLKKRLLQLDNHVRKMAKATGVYE